MSVGSVVEGIGRLNLLFEHCDGPGQALVFPENKKFEISEA